MRGVLRPIGHYEYKGFLLYADLYGNVYEILRTVIELNDDLMSEIVFLRPISETVQIQTYDRASFIFATSLLHS